MAGTSVATAKVSGGISQVWAANPELSYRQVIEVVKNTAQDLGEVGWDAETGAGLFNLPAAVALAKETQGEVYQPNNLLIPTTWGGEDKFTPTERAASEKFWKNGKYYDWIPYQIQQYDTLGAIAQQTLGSSAYDYYMWIAQHNNIANPHYIVAGDWIEIPKEVAPPPTYQVTGDFYDTWNATGGASGILGQPTSLHWHYIDNGGERQNFQGGAILKSDHGIFPVFGGIGSHYLNQEGGQKGRLGFPTSKEIGVGNGVIHQHFENGYIRYGDGPTRTIMESPDSKQSVIDNGGWWADYYNGDFAHYYGSEELPDQTAWGKLSKYWGHGGPKGLTDNYSMRLSAKRYLEPGKYLIKVGADDRSRVRIDGQELISAWFNGSFGQQAYFESQGGYHDIEVDYKEDFLSAGISLDWLPQFVNINGFTVDGEFFPVYDSHETGLGNPTSNVQTDANGNNIQEFENGVIVENQYGVFPLYGQIGEQYQQDGGATGVLGQPTSEPVDLGNGFLKQSFEGGYIIWNGQKAISYITGTGTPTTPPPKNEPLPLSLVGFDGQSVHQTYVNTFNRNGGHEVLGFPINNVHPWAGGYTQDFDWGSAGRGAIMKSNVNDNSYWVGGQIWEKFLDLGGAEYVGYPKTDAIPVQGGLDDSGGFVQHFRGAKGIPSKIWLSKHGAHPTWGAIGGKYDKLGGPSSWLGFPTSREQGIGNGWVKQHFEGGYMLWHPSHGAIAYDTEALNRLPDSGESSTFNWHAQYWDNRNLTGSPEWSKYEDMSDLRFHASNGAPQGTRGIPEDNFGARWITTSYFDGGIYNFINRADDGVRVYVDGELIIDKWKDSPFEEKRAFAAIEPGYHQVMVEYFEHGGSAANSLRWEAVNTPAEWSGEVFNNVSLSGKPEGHLTEDSTFLDQDWSSGSIPDLLSPPDEWGLVPGKAHDISIGADGSIWVIGSDRTSGGYSIHQWTGNDWRRVPGGATQIAVASDGTPWVVNSSGNIYKRNGNQWQIMPGQAKDISIGADGSVWSISEAPTSSGKNIQRWDGQNWQTVRGVAKRVSVAPDGTPWVVNYSGNIYKRNGNQWQQMPGQAKDIEIGADGSVWIIGETPVSGGYNIQRWDGQNWQTVRGGAKRVSVAPDGTPWVVNSGENIYVRGSDVSNDDRFSDRWSTTRYFDEPGVYEFDSQADDGIRVWVDDQLVIDKWHDQGFITNKALVPLDKGYHRIRVEHYENKYSSALELDWKKVAGQPMYWYGSADPNGWNSNGSGWLQPWTAEYFNNRELQGAPVVTRLEKDNFLEYTRGFERDWGHGSPDSEINVDNFSSRLTSHRYLGGGTYKFKLQGDDGMRFFINGEKIIDRWENPPFSPHEVEVTLSEGIHNLRVEHSEGRVSAYANLDWDYVSDGSPHTIAPELQAAHDELENTLGEGAVGLPISEIKNESFVPYVPPGLLGPAWVLNATYQEFRGTQGRGALFPANGNKAHYVFGKLWEAYQNAGGVQQFGPPVASQKHLGNGAYELELESGRLFWAPGMTNPTFYEYAESGSKTLTIPADAWRGEYFANRNWSGDPLVVRQDSITDKMAKAWQQLPGKAKDISIGANGSMWMIGTNPSGNGYGIYQWTDDNWQEVGGAATQIAVAPDGTPWVVNSQGNIYKREGNHWKQMSKKAKDISIDPDGMVWVIGDNPTGSGYGIHRWDGQKWQEIGGAATRITVGPDGTPWVVNSQGNIYKREGNGWKQIPGLAKDIEVGIDGSVWRIGTNPTGSGYGIYSWNGENWTAVEGAATRVTVGIDGTPWVVNSKGNIYSRTREVPVKDYSLDKYWNWSVGSPAPGLPEDNFSVRWTSNRPFDRGTYRFKAAHDDGFTVTVNGQKPINKMMEVATQTTGYGTFTHSGQYPIEVKHREYGGSAKAKLNYEKASNYVVGLNKHNKKYQAIIDAFNRHGGYAKLGIPKNDVHGWSSHGIIQDFNNGPNGAGIVMQRYGSNKAYYISGKIRQAFLDHGGPGKLGYPTSDPFWHGNVTRQNFEGGYITLHPNTAKVHYNGGGGSTNPKIDQFINWAKAQNRVITRHDRHHLGAWSDGECVTLIARYIQDVFMSHNQRSRPGQAYNHGYGTASTVSNLPYFGSYTTRGGLNSNPPRRGGVISFMGYGFNRTYGHVGIVTRYDAAANRIYYIDIGKSQGGVVTGEKSISATSAAIRGWTNPK
ncbi:PA14 domain-containing protein [Spirulina sp. CS-785/01]|uniref:tectonin domain-containing protein n=1 Tax=Spirulina sp. CS-785/01 TaxID=3021716 RepID=UPI00232C18BF|nr:tectonin domain-containing protein [Spirulina sp. CS-785/01]MDB9311617.1 PA14 domain-containing protein [Spirulina sp. CS-785/01]